MRQMINLANQLLPEDLSHEIRHEFLRRSTDNGSTSNDLDARVQDPARRSWRVFGFAQRLALWQWVAA
jgi:hypothetical protein